jgi:polysaccharide biosynthesis protein PslH
VKAGGLVPPDVGGKIRSYNILRELAAHHAVTVFTFYAEHPDDHHGELSKLFERVIFIPLRVPLPRSRGEVLHFAQHLFSPLPYTVAKHTLPQVKSAMASLVTNESYDVVVCDFAIAGAVVPWELPCPKVLFTHNVEALIWKRYMEVARNPVWKAVCWREYKTMARFENRWLKAADHVLTVSETDREYFSGKIPKEKITVIPTGVDTNFFQPPATRVDEDCVVFTGAMDWLPNEDGIVYFANEIMPRLQREIPGVKATIVGRNPSARVKALAGSNIEVTGRVEDIRPYVAEAAVYVVPLRIGSGTRLKIFEAMAMGKAVVSTTIGAEGLPVRDGKHLLLADSAPDFASRIVELLRDAPRREALGAAARKLVEESYSWEAVTKIFANVLESVVAGQKENAPLVSTDSR